MKQAVKNLPITVEPKIKRLLEEKRRNRADIEDEKLAIMIDINIS